MLEQEQMLDVLAAADRERALVMVHAENHEMIQWITKRLLERGHGAPKYHMTAHHVIAEGEATHRVVALSRLLDVPVLIVHVSGGEAVQTIRAAQTLGARVFAETGPQYLFLQADDADRPGHEGAKWCCSPPRKKTLSPRRSSKPIVDLTSDVEEMQRLVDVYLSFVRGEGREPPPTLSPMSSRQTGPSRDCRTRYTRRTAPAIRK